MLSCNNWRNPCHYNILDGHFTCKLLSLCFCYCKTEIGWKNVNIFCCNKLIILCRTSSGTHYTIGGCWEVARKWCTAEDSYAEANMQSFCLSFKPAFTSGLSTLKDRSIFLTVICFLWFDPYARNNCWCSYRYLRFQGDFVRYVHAVFHFVAETEKTLCELNASKGPATWWFLANQSANLSKMENILSRTKPLEQYLQWVF